MRKNRRRWSKLQKRLYKLMVPEVNFQIHCALYEMKSKGHYGDRLPRYFITVDKDIIFDYPKDIALKEKYKYLWENDISEISDTIEKYVQCPKEMLFSDFADDKWGIVDIFRACDKRVGKKRLQQLYEKTENTKIQIIIKKRINKTQE